MAQIAAQENITDNYVSNLIHLAWLPPQASAADIGWRSDRYYLGSQQDAHPHRRPPMARLVTRDVEAVLIFAFDMRLAQAFRERTVPNSASAR
ncbi:hypothetical protein [Bradyrhizobium sp. 6(2017)]|uniref:hypothetical protein n=1 Tax=Bradyrhizobium sp. 6(2017) TaxID=1197460 RepID=UPI001FEE333F|nr:hypothetical protein [Bradyrhizobium sp. 6(2017)]